MEKVTQVLPLKKAVCSLIFPLTVLLPCAAVLYLRLYLRANCSICCSRQYQLLSAALRRFF